VCVCVCVCARVCAHVLLFTCVLLLVFFPPPRPAGVDVCSLLFYDLASLHLSYDFKFKWIWSFEVCWRLYFFCFVSFPSSLVWSPPSLIFNWYCGFFYRVKRPGVKLANHLRLVPKLRMSGAIPLLPLYTFMTWTFNFFLLHLSSHPNIQWVLFSSLKPHSHYRFLWHMPITVHCKMSREKLSYTFHELFICQALYSGTRATYLLGHYVRVDTTGELVNSTYLLILSFRSVVR
jgi:hypothetical protein